MQRSSTKPQATKVHNTSQQQHHNKKHDTHLSQHSLAHLSLVRVQYTVAVKVKSLGQTVVLLAHVSVVVLGTRNVCGKVSWQRLISCDK